MFDNVRAALNSIWGNKLRSLLTLLGVVIGVSSVTTLIALGEGLKSDMSSLIQGMGTNVIAVMTGKIDTESGGGQNPANFFSGDILTLDDVADIEAMEEVEHVTPVALVAGTVKRGEKSATPTIFSTYPNVMDAFQLFSLKEGRMFSARSGKEIVLSEISKNQLFGDESALGQTVAIGDQEFEVVGVFNPPATSNALSTEYDNVSAIPFDEATAFNKGQTSIMRIVLKARDDTDVNELRDRIKETLLANHNGEENFTVFTQEDLLDLFGQFLNLATAMVSAIAAISLLVGGIGIMNIMLVTVTERTREIGLRKAVGATRAAILVQFLTEAVVITVIGGLIGLGLAIAAGLVVEAQTPLKPAFSQEVFLVTAGISLVVGVIFGIWPALRAAYKDPIEALRYE